MPPFTRPTSPHPLENGFKFSPNPDWDHQIDSILDGCDDTQSVDSAWKLFFKNHLDFPFKIWAESGSLPEGKNSTRAIIFKLDLMKLADESKYPLHEIVFVGHDPLKDSIHYIFSGDIRGVNDDQIESMFILYRYWQRFYRTRI